MLRPVRMTLANIVLFKEDVPALMRTLAEMECLQVEGRVSAKDEGALAAVDTRAAAQALDALGARLAQAARECNAAEFEVDDGEVRVDPRGIAAVIEAEFAPVEREMARLTQQLRSAEQRREKAELTSWVLSGLEYAGVDAGTVRSARYVAVEIGAVPRGGYARLAESLAFAGHRIFSMGNIGTRTLICAVTPVARHKELIDGLNAARFEKVSVAEELFAEGTSAADASEMEMWQVREDITETGLAIAGIAEKWGAGLSKWRREIEVNTRLLAAMEDFLEGTYTSLVTGWIPTAKLATLPGALAKRCGGPVEVAAAPAEAAGEAGGTQAQPPTELSNIGLLRPFELLVKFYGSPAYDGIDPTPFVAFTFSIIFGAMFGDAGHGFVLGLAGFLAWYLSRRGSTLGNAGAILTWCGATSTFFGFMYGSIFGYEDVIRPLWRQPMADPGGFLFAGVILGVFVINLGLLINLAQRLWARKYKEALLGEWGASTLLFYWGVVGLFYLAATGRAGNVTTGTVAWILGPPLVLTTFGSEVYDRLTHAKGEHEMAGLFIRPMELMMGSLSNTISFMRVSAFALNHAALMGTVFLFAGMLRSPGFMGSAFEGLDIVLGNILVMCLEGIMVFVQVLRLHYYEFFSKFFITQGRPFEPLSLRSRRSGV